MILAAAAAAATLAACGRASNAGYAPGLGEFMTATQERHIKLWFAGRAGNWPLAAYELDELREGFGDLVKLHPTWHGAPVPIKDILPRLTRGPLEDLGEAVQAHDKAAFTKAFDELTNACNACHRAEKHAFNVIKRPASNPYPDQRFRPAPH